MLHHLYTRICLRAADGTVPAGDPLLESLDAERRATLIATPTDRRTHRCDIHLQGAGETVFLEFT
ncbi:hypothetical protein [Streptomyces sp. NPDC057582]|uniref:hypothetical protein n=1 Tax=Streptomyces sp. NPDC057582 TaxID=3346174 RepID=UPI0036A2C071